MNDISELGLGLFHRFLFPILSATSKIAFPFTLTEIFPAIAK